MPTKRSSIGENVMAKWPGSSLWFPAKITGYYGKNYEVVFQDGTEYEIEPKYVNDEVTFKRSSSRSRSKSPSRKSPSRKSSGRPRSRSSARRKASPSPNRRKASPSPNRRKASPSPNRRPSTSPRRGRSRKKEAPVTSTPKSTVTKTVHTEIIKTYATRSATKKGEKTLELPLDMHLGKVPKTTEEAYSGTVGCIISIVFFVAVVFYPYLICTQESCAFFKRPVLPNNLASYFDQEVTILYLGFLGVMVVLNLLPIGLTFEGPRTRSGQRMKYRQNGFLMLILTLALVGIAHHFDKLRIAVAYEKRLQLITISTVISFLFSVLAFIKSKWAPPNSLSPRGNSGKVVYDFFVGHELHPRICKTFDLKMFVYRVGLIQLTLLNLVNIGRMCQSEGKPTIAILFAAAFMGWYVLDSFWFEDRIVHCLEFSGDGFGFRLIFGCLTVMPFFMSFPTWYLIQYSPELSKLAVAGIVVFQLVGMVVYRGSNSQKWEFRRNPYNPKLAHLESIRTNAGTRLLVSGWWGCVRHPNYLGDILLTIGFVLPCGCAHFLPWILPVTCIVEQVVREIRDSEKCRKKYGSSWNEYCEKVKYRLVPYIY